MKKAVSSKSLMHMCCHCMCMVSRVPKSDMLSFLARQLCAA